MMHQQAQQQAQQQQQAPFVPLTGSIVSYIVDLVNHMPPITGAYYKNSDLILSVYKAFECYTEEDALRDYKKNIQHFIANYLFGQVMEELQSFGAIELVWYNSTDREVMYLYDILFCGPDALLHGEHFAELKQRIDAEVFDCNYYLERLRTEYEYDEHKPSIMRQDIPIVRFLEEAIYNKSTDSITCLIQSGLYSKHMLMYIYLKHNHKVWGANNPHSLINNDLLFKMMLNVADDSYKSLLLEIAISGLTIKHTNTRDLFHNAVHPNLALVKKLVPDYFPRDKEIISLIGDIGIDNSFEMKPNEFDLNYYRPHLTPYAIWNGYNNRQLYAPLFSRGQYQICTIPRNEEIGEYLRC